MTVGIATASLNSMLNTLFDGTYAKLHTGDPGSAGTANASGTTTRVAVPWGSASGGAKTTTGAMSWPVWAVSDEVLTHITLWTASSGGSFVDSLILTNARSITAGDTMVIDYITITPTPQAA